MSPDIEFKMQHSDKFLIDVDNSDSSSEDAQNINPQKKQISALD